MMAAIIANSTCTSTPAVADGTMPTTTIAVSTSCVSPTLFKALRRVIGIRVLRVDDETPSISCAIRARKGLTWRPILAVRPLSVHPPIGSWGAREWVGLAGYGKQTMGDVLDT